MALVSVLLVNNVDIPIPSSPIYSLRATFRRHIFINVESSSEYCWLVKETFLNQNVSSFSSTRKLFFIKILMPWVESRFHKIVSEFSSKAGWKLIFRTKESFLKIFGFMVLFCLQLTTISSGTILSRYLSNEIMSAICRRWYLINWLFNYTNDTKEPFTPLLVFKK